MTTVDVPSIAAPGRWNPADPPGDGRETRQRWGGFQRIRSWLPLAGFVLLCVVLTLRS